MCECETLHPSVNFDEWEGYWSLLELLSREDSFVEIPVEKPYLDVGFTENWYLCRRCGKTWQLVKPDPPFAGLWSQIS